MLNCSQEPILVEQDAKLYFIRSMDIFWIIEYKDGSIDYCCAEIIEDIGQCKIKHTFKINKPINKIQLVISHPGIIK